MELLWPLTLTFCMNITFVNDNFFWKFHDDTMTETVKKLWRTDRCTDRWQMDRTIHRAAWSQLKNKANLRDFITVTGLVILFKLDSNHQFFGSYDLEIWWMTSKNHRAPFLCYVKLCATFHSHQWIQTGVTVRKCSIQVKIINFLSRVNWKYDYKATFLCYLKLYASFHSHQWIQIGVTVQKPQFGSKLVIFLSRVTLKFEGWASKTIEHLSYATSNFVLHFITICEFKQELWSRNG